MSNFSQAQLEIKYIRSQEQMRITQNFGEMEEWTLYLGQMKAILEPATGNWLWYMKIENEWVTAGCKVGEAILIATGNAGGYKKLPQPGDVSEWCVYRNGQQFVGPVLTTDMIRGLEASQIPVDINVWSPLATTWLTVSRNGNGFSFMDEQGVRVQLVAEVKKPSASLPLQQAGPQTPPPFSIVPPTIVPSNQQSTPPPYPGSEKTQAAELCILNGFYQGRRYPIHDQFTIGRDMDNNLALPDAKVSRHHAVLLKQGQDYQVIDKGSSNGTLVNGMLISSPVILKKGDSLLIGDTQLLFTC